MDPLNDYTSEAHRLASQARRAFLEGHSNKAYEYLVTLSFFLTKSSFINVSEPCEPANTSGPSHLDDGLD